MRSPGTGNQGSPGDSFSGCGTPVSEDWTLGPAGPGDRLGCHEEDSGRVGRPPGRDPVSEWVHRGGGALRALRPRPHPPQRALRQQLRERRQLRPRVPVRVPATSVSLPDLGVGDGGLSRPLGEGRRRGKGGDWVFQPETHGPTGVVSSVQSPK